MPIKPNPDAWRRFRRQVRLLTLLGLLLLPAAHGADEAMLEQSVRQWLQQEVAAHAPVSGASAAAADAASADAKSAGAPLALRAIYGVGARLTAEFQLAGAVWVARPDAPRLRGPSAGDAGSATLVQVRAPCVRLRQPTGAMAEACIVPEAATHD